mgnify:CR=1 FL=1
MYRTIEDSLTDKSNGADFAMKFLREFPGLRLTDTGQFITCLGRGDWYEAEDWLKLQIGGLLTPE